MGKRVIILSMEKLNQKQAKYLLIAGALVILLILLFLTGGNKASYTVPSVQQASSTNVAETNTKTTSGSNAPVKTTTTTNTAQSANQKCNLHVSYPVSGSSIGFPLTIKGTLDIAGESKYPCVWTDTQQIAGTVQVFYDVNGTGWRPSGIPVSIFSSGTISTSTMDVASSIISLNSVALGIPSGTPIKLTLSDFVPGGNPKNTFDIIVYLK